MENDAFDTARRTLNVPLITSLCVLVLLTIGLFIGYLIDAAWRTWFLFDLWMLAAAAVLIFMASVFVVLSGYPNEITYGTAFIGFILAIVIHLIMLAITVYQVTRDAADFDGYPVVWRVVCLVISGLGMSISIVGAYLMARVDRAAQEFREDDAVLETAARIKRLQSGELRQRKT